MKKLSELKIKNAKSKRLLYVYAFFIFYFLFLTFNSYAQPLTANAGANTSVCLSDSVQIGGTPSASGGTSPYTFSWKPTTGLDVTSSANPNAFPASTTTYTLTVTDKPGNTATSLVTVSVLPLPLVSAGGDQTASIGADIVLHASGAVNYFWFPGDGLSDQNIANPLANPGSTTTYCVAGVGANGCVNYDCMKLAIIPSDTIIIYNAFSPNADGVNDFLYIGNIEKYPDNKLEVFNRNGKLVFQQSHYANDWNGKVDGAELPCATYYIVFTLGKGKEKKGASVTIIR